MPKKKSPKDKQNVYETVRSGYAKIAVENASCCNPVSSCCGSSAAPDAERLAKAVGYDEGDLSNLPEGANMGLSCGNPSAIAGLKTGETVLDLGSGGGFDAFIVARKVGEQGKVIGVDMTPEMLSKARKNAVSFAGRTGLRNVEFRLGEIEHLPIPDKCVDVIISNCVINLSPDKPQVWREMARVLKPGGRAAVSDLALRQPLPEKICDSVEALVGCVAGAILIEETRKMAEEAGFEKIQIEEKSAYIEAMASSNDPLYRGIMELLPQGKQLSDYITSIRFSGKTGK